MDKPKKSFRAGPITASVFVNVRKVDGKNTEIPSVSFHRSDGLKGDRNRR